MTDLLAYQMMNLSLEPTSIEKDRNHYDINQLVNDFQRWILEHYKLNIDLEVINIIKHHYNQIVIDYQNRYLIIIYPYHLATAIIIHMLRQYYPYSFNDHNIEIENQIIIYFMGKSQSKIWSRFNSITQNLITQFFPKDIGHNV